MSKGQALSVLSPRLGDGRGNTESWLLQPLEGTAGRVSGRLAVAGCVCFAPWIPGGNLMKGPTRSCVQEQPMEQVWGWHKLAAVPPDPWAVTRARWLVPLFGRGKSFADTDVGCWVPFGFSWRGVPGQFDSQVQT